MQEQSEYIVTTAEDLSQIELVKLMIQDIHEKGRFFDLSLKTLELIRRFNNLYKLVQEEGEANPSWLHQLVICSINLEKDLQPAN